jgi:hypothetical protein
MFHNNTQRMIQDWTAKRGDRAAPARADISPAAYRELLPQVFMLGSEANGDEAFRLAGGLLADLHARDLRGADFLGLWMPTERQQVRDALALARRCGAPVVLSASGWTHEGDEARLEIVLAPLTGPTGELDRVMGLYQPTSSLRRLMGRPITAMTVSAIKLADQALPIRDLAPEYADYAGDLYASAPPARSRSHLRLVAVDGRRLD